MFFYFFCILFRYRLAPYMIENVTKRGYQQPTPIQMQAIPLMIHVSTCSWTEHTHKMVGSTMQIVLIRAHDNKHDHSSQLLNSQYEAL